MKARSLVLAGCFWLCILSAHAQSPEGWAGLDAALHAEEVIGNCVANQDYLAVACVDPPFQSCILQRGDNQRERNSCSQLVRAGWNARLEELLAAVRAAAPAAALDQFEASQEQWEAATETYCTLVSEFWGDGSIRPMETYLCFAQHTAYRAADLEYLAYWWSR
jgi:hypothetical protein